MTETQRTHVPIIPLKNSVLFPYLVIPISVGRPSSMKAAEAAWETEEKSVFLVTQRSPDTEEPQQEDLYSIGTRAVIKRMSKPEAEEHYEVVVEGIERSVLLKIDEEEGGFFSGRIRTLPVDESKGPEIEALHREVLELFSKAISLAKSGLKVAASDLASVTEDPLRLAYMLSTILSIDVKKEQALLEAPSVVDALRLMHIYLTYEVQVLELRNKIASEAQTEMSREQREYFLRQQLRAIQEELGESDPETAEVSMLQEQLEKAELPELVRKEAERELGRLRRLPPGAPDYNVIRSYLELVLELPWSRESEDFLDLSHARQVLDEDHYDLKEIKERILEHLGVLKMNPSAKAPILCFVGPPGVGKTSLGQSIAKALKRKFERMSLGGMHDEAELRGHRRTYIGSMPGRIIQAIRRAGVRNPLIMLDEVDKLGRDFRGDPAFALLEILDPEQNRDFRDNYLDLPFDLSKVFFITTANSLDTIPRPLLDRLEILHLSGYSEEEKMEIAKRYLIGRRLKEAGLTPQECRITDSALQSMISGYTREAGVRQLERTIGRVARKIALRFAEGNAEPIEVDPKQLAELLGPENFYPEQARQVLPVGVAPGLAWTEAGGEVLYVEATFLPKGKDMILTGQLGGVMQESAKTALSYVWSHSEELGGKTTVLLESGVHVHVPAGAIPKDGPSAGVTMTAAIASLHTGHALRSDTAMTGEVTLTGLVLPVGGIKEKILAARRAGIRRVILPRQNLKDLQDLPEDVMSDVEFISVDNVRQVLDAAFVESGRPTEAAALEA